MKPQSSQRNIMGVKKKSPQGGLLLWFDCTDSQGRIEA
jgi:hypothetical protein